MPRDDGKWLANFKDACFSLCHLATTVHNEVQKPLRHSDSLQDGKSDGSLLSSRSVGGSLTRGHRRLLGVITHEHSKQLCLAQNNQSLRTMLART